MRGKKQKEPVGMNAAEIFAAVAMLEKERGIPQSFMMSKIIQAVTTAYKRDHDGVENVIVEADEEHQTLKMFVQKNVVDEEDYVDPANEMTLAEAKHLSAKTHHSRCEGKAGSGGRLEEQCTEDLTLTAFRIQLGVLHNVGCKTNKSVNFLGSEIKNIYKVSHFYLLLAN